MSPRWRRVVVTIAAVAGAAVTARLGLWQLDRAQEKAAIQAAIDQRAQLPPITDAAQLAGDAAAAGEQFYRPARLQGHWAGAHTVFLDNRQMNGRPGFLVVTPFVLADGSAVAVQRGWVPRNFVDRTQLPAVPTPGGNLALAGRIAPPPARLYEFDAGEGGRIRQNLDLDAYARETALTLRPLSLLLAESPAAAGDGLQRDWPAASAGLSKNKGYAFQWFGLSALIVFLYVWFQLIPPWRRRAKP